LPADPVVDEVTLSSQYAGPFAEFPLTITITGERLDRFEEAVIRATDGDGRNILQTLDNVTASEVTLTLDSIDALPIAPAGDTSYTVELRGNNLSQDVSIELWDYLDRKEVSGVLEDYLYTLRVAVEGKDVFTMMREQPDRDSTATAPLRNGDLLEIVSEEVEGWYQARIAQSSDPNSGELEGQIWWIERWLVDNEGVPPEPTPVPTAVPAPPSSGGGSSGGGNTAPPPPAQPAPPPQQPAPPPPPPPEPEPVVPTAGID
jgi:hypothetical protein